MIKSDMRTRVKDVADVTGNSRWSTAYIDAVISRAHRAGWRTILNACNTYRAAARSVTTSSAGLVPFTSLSSGSGDSAQTFYRILGVRAGTAVYSEAPAGDWLLGTDTGIAPTQKYFVANQNVYMPDALSTAVVIWVNHLPTAFNSLATDGSTVAWIDDYEDCLIYQAAADLLAKGGTEMSMTADLLNLANDWWADLLADVSRFTVNPLQFQYSDLASDFGG